jgi:WD40 repeat protein
MARTWRQFVAFGGIFILATTAWSEVPKPTADDARKIEGLFRTERQQAAESGAAARFPAAWVQRAEEFAKQAEAAQTAGLFDEASTLFREARWRLPSLPANLPPHVARIFGDPRLKHGHFVRAVAYSPDSTKLASASRDGTVKIWDLGNGRELMAFHGHGNEDVRAVAFSPDGRTIASAGGNLIKVWDPVTGNVKQTLTGHTSYINSLAFRPDGQRIASGGDDRSVRIWDLATGKEQLNLGAQNAMIHAVAYSRDGKLLASVNGEGRLNVYAPDNSDRRQPLGMDAHSGAAYDVEFTPDGKWIATCGADRRLVLIGAPGSKGEPLDTTGAKKREFTGHTEPVTSLALSPDGKYLVSGSRDLTVRLWDLNSGQVLRTFLGHTEEVAALAFAPNGRQIASGGHDQTVKVWNLDPVDAHRAFQGHKGPVWSAIFSPDGRRIASGGADRVVHIWDAATGREWKSLSGHSQAITALAFHPGGALLASAGGERVIRIWDLESGQTTKQLEGHEAPVLAVAFRPDGRQILSGSADRTARLWDVTTGQTIAVLGGHSGIVTAVAVRPDGAQAATACADGMVRLWNLAEGNKEETSFRAHETGGVAAIAYSPDGQQLATCSGDRQVRIWNLAAKPIKDPIARLQGHSGPLLSVAFSPNGQFLASGGADQVVKVWNVQSKSDVRSFRAHTDWVTSVAFASDGRSIVSASVDQRVLLWRFLTDQADSGVGHSRRVTAVAVGGNGQLFASAADDRTVRLWNPATGAELRILTGHLGKITALAVSPDSKRIVTAAEDLKTKLWDAETGRELLTHDGIDKALLLAYSVDGRKILEWYRHQGSADEETVDGVRVSDSETLKQIDVLMEKGRRVSCLALSTDGTLVAMGSADGSVRLWDIVKKERVGGDRPMHPKALQDLALTPDKKSLIAADKDGNIKISSVEKPAESRSIHAGGAYLDGLLVSPDGTRLVTFGDGRVELWDLATDKVLRSWTVGAVGAISFTPDGKHLLAGLNNSTLYLLDLP